MNNRTTFVQSVYSLASIQKQKLVISGVNKPRVWVEIAELLIDRFQFEGARTFLDEAGRASQALNDHSHMMELVAYNYALMSYHLRDWGRVVSALESTMWSENTQDFWLKKTLLLVDALHRFSEQSNSFQNHIDDTGLQKAKVVLHSALRAIERASASRPNGVYLGPYMRAKLLTRLAGISHTESMEENQKSSEKENEEQRIELLSKACKLYGESHALFEKLGYTKESFEVMLLKIETQKVCLVELLFLLVPCASVYINFIMIWNSNFSSCFSFQKNILCLIVQLFKIYCLRGYPPAYPPRGS